MDNRDRVRVPSVQRSESKPAANGLGTDSVDRSKTDFIRHFRGHHSARGSVSPESDIRFQSIVSRETHQRIREARRGLKHEPFNPGVDVPRAVASNLVNLHAHNCGAYTEVVKNGKRKKK